MLKGGAFDLASRLGGKIEKAEVFSAIDKYEKYHACFGGVEEERKANCTDMLNLKVGDNKLKRIKVRLYLFILLFDQLHVDNVLMCYGGCWCYYMSNAYGISILLLI